MAQDSIVGTWVVNHLEGAIPKFKYKYTFSAPTGNKPGSVQWRDFWDAGSNGVGTWTRIGGRVNINWTRSSTTNEYLMMAPTVLGDRASGVATTSYGTFATLAERTDVVDPTQDLMQQWADNYGNFESPYICPWAIPYSLYIAPKKTTFKPNKAPLTKINGLAVHTTWIYQSLSGPACVSSCVNDWAGRGVGAHFIIVTDGTLIQVNPINRVANAQGGIANNFWISVEIQTRESEATPNQIMSAQFLFSWVVGKVGCRKALATGFVGDCLVPKDPMQAALAANAKRDYDPVTKRICSETTTKLNEAVMSSGLSCHYWLYPIKPCPGTPLLKQLPLIAKGY
ncbi:N-acetylmuramoyl-L-alanine amidase [Methylobacterium brachythecii]|nr:N-acetylmuramoyl-L-alanine amidase [Methylobacterium brachythecii]